MSLVYISKHLCNNTPSFMRGLMKNSTKDKIMDVVVDLIMIGFIGALILSIFHVFYLLFKVAFND